jgi:hypothetical protein
MKVFAVYFIGGEASCTECSAALFIRCWMWVSLISSARIRNVGFHMIWKFSDQPGYMVACFTCYNGVNAIFVFICAGISQLKNRIYFAYII